MNPIIKRPTEKEKAGAQKWPIWEKEISTFPWEYTSQETCLVLEGDVIVTNELGRTFHFGTGDYVVFPKGMKCMWDIKKPVRKHYNLK